MSTWADYNGRPLEVGDIVYWAGEPTDDEVAIVTYLDAEAGVGLLCSDGSDADCTGTDDASELVILDVDTEDHDAVAYLRELLPAYTDPNS